MTDYWERRLEKVGKPPFILRLLNGMTPPVPEATVRVTKVVRRKKAGILEENEHVGPVKIADTANTTVSKLGDSSQEIGNVIKLITSIAQQTNQQAVNATIEAARAGEAGKGFAVVAQEVKTHATQTAKATGEIGAQIAEMQAATRDSVTAIKEIGATIGRMSEIAMVIASAVEEQSATTAEITRSSRLSSSKRRVK